MLDIKPGTFDSFCEAIKRLDYTGYAEQYPPFGSWADLDGRGACVLSAWRKSLKVTRENGLFINVPFCRSKCRFCFLPVTCIGAADPAGSVHFKEYFTALDREASVFSPLFRNTVMSTVYVGGGSPSLMTPVQIERFFALVRRRFRIAETAQIILEIHPSDITPGKLAAYRAAGVDRVCLGVQSLDSGVLSGNGRRQELAHVRTAYRMLRKSGLNKVNVDLICGLPGQDGNSFLKDLEKVIAFRPDQVHLNTFINTPYTPYALAGGKQQNGELVEKTRSAGFRLLKKAGYLRIDSDSMGLTPDSRNRQTTGLGGRRSVLGLGPGAVSHAYGNMRSINRADWGGYRAAALKGIIPVDKGVMVGARDEMINYAIIRFSDDLELDLEAFRLTHGLRFEKVFPAELKALERHGAVVSERKLKIAGNMWNTVRRVFYGREIPARGLKNIRAR